MPQPIRYAGANLYPKQRAAIFDAERVTVIEASTKAGKGQPLDALVYTPTGPVAMGSLKVGDLVATPDGASAPVVGIYPLGVRPIYDISFGDGTRTECTEDHLWEVHAADRYKITSKRGRYVNYKGWPKLLELRQLAQYSDLHRRAMWIPKTAPVPFAKREVPLDPYLLGALLGDGSFRGSSVGFSSADEHIVARIAAATPSGYSVRPQRPMVYGIAKKVGSAAAESLWAPIAELGLRGRLSSEKFIPAIYRHNDAATRWELVRGLFDTDGFVDNCGQPAFCTTSEELARDLLEIIQSLGDIARVSVMPNGYRKPDGTYVPCKKVYWLVVRTMQPRSYFSLPRKLAKVKLRQRVPKRKVREIQWTRDAEAQCIEIAHPDGLYLTNDFIVTHNTVGCLAWLLEQALRSRSGHNVWWTAPVYSQSEIGFRRMKSKLPRSFYKENKSKLTLRLANGVTVWFKSADRPDDLYGEDVYACVMDEASRMREDAWIAVRTTLTATRGPVRIIGNVKGRKNWFYTLARAAENGAEGMSYHRITAWDAVDAGVLDRDEIEASLRDFKRLGREGAWRQLYMAEAASDEDNPFGLEAIQACVIGDLSTERPRVAGVDLAGRGASNVNPVGADQIRERDYSAIVMLDREGQATHVSRFQKPHTETANEIARVVGRTPALIDSTGAGDPVVESLQRRGNMFVEGYRYTEQSRQDLLEGLALAIGEQAVGFPDGWLRDELDSFEFSYGRRAVRYVVPDGAHDDGAMALALAVKKLPWRRRSGATPIGVAKESTWRETPGAGEPAPAAPSQQTFQVPVPMGVKGPGAGRWRIE